MAKTTAKQRKALAYGRAKRQANIRAEKRLKNKFGLSGFDMSWKKAKPNLADAFTAGGLTLIGVVAGRELEKKVFKSNEKEGFMQYLADILKVGGGVVAATQDNKFLKYIGAGVALEGALSAGGRAMGKDLLGDGILNGLQGFWDESISGTLTNAKAYDELPPLPGHEDGGSENEDKGGYSSNEDENSDEAIG